MDSIKFIIYYSYHPFVAMNPWITFMSIIVRRIFNHVIVLFFFALCSPIPVLSIFTCSVPAAAMFINLGY